MNLTDMRRLATTTFFTLVLSFLSVGLVMAQEKTVTGTVTDGATGQTLPGANVSVQGTSTGTTTNMNGEYEITVPGPDAVLVFSFVGYLTQEVEVGDQTTINVTLQEDVAQLQELVVVGYGEQEERDVTGVVQKVNTAEFNKGNVVSPEQLISGKVAGVQITSTSGAPGASSFIRIRGATSVNADSSPLFVIDGVPIDNDGNQASRNPLNFLNPNDIANVTVLKDASATAIYGSRGANGVIIIETKSAGEDEGQISYNGSVSSFNVADRVDVLDADQFRQVVRERAPSQASLLGDANTDWQNAVERDAIAHEHNLSFSRGYEDSNFRFSLGYLDQEGVLQTSETQRTSLSFKYDQDLLDDRLTIRTSLRGSQTDNQFEPGLVGGSASFDPTQPIRDPNSEFGGFFEWDQPGLELAENNPVATYILTTNTGETNRVLGNVEAELEIPYVTGLTARVKAGFDLQNGEREFFQPTFLKGQVEADDQAGQVERANFSRTNELFDAFLTYDRDFDSIESSFNATAGYSWQEFHAEFPEFTARGLNSNFLGPNSTDPVTDQQNTSTFVTEIPNKLISGFARLNYTFKDRYLVTATVRRDGSSRFGPENQWGTFPSAALAWRAHQESFIQNVDWLSNLKVRGSWGMTGNQEIGDFLFSSLWTPGGPQAQIQLGDEFVSTIRPSAADETIQWEETTTWNLGIDYGFFDGRVSGSFEYYIKDTDDLLFTVPAPGGANLSDRVLTNIGSMRNEGFEFSVDGMVLTTEDFSWNAQFNASTNENELLEVTRAGEGIPTGGISGGIGNTIQIIREGEPINSFLVYRHKENENGDPISDGVDANGDGVANDLDMYVDQNGDGVINDADRVVGENPQPDWILGHTSRLTYGNFDLSFTLRAQLGNHVYNNVASNFGRYDRLTNFAPSNLHTSVLTTDFQTPQFFSDYYVEDASFLRLDNVTIGYTVRDLPGVDRARVFGTVQNAFVITGYSGPDPEVVGIDNNLYPRSRTFTAGVNVQL